jgi:hypothetical protein
MGRKKIDLNYEKVGQEYLKGAELIPLGKKYGVSRWTLLKKFKELGVRKNTKRTLNKKAFSVFTPESCYWTGFLAADGYVWKGYSLGCELSLNDKNHLNKLCSFLQSNAKIEKRTREKFGKMLVSARVQFNSVELVRDLETNFNITRNKSLSYRSPKLPLNMVKHFIRGYIDGDGSIGWHKHNKTLRLNICSGSKDLLEWILVQFKHNMIGVGSPSIVSRKKSNLHTIEFMGSQAVHILQWLYQDFDVFLDRKYQKFLEITA